MPLCPSPSLKIPHLHHTCHLPEITNMLENWSWDSKQPALSAVDSVASTDSGSEKAVRSPSSYTLTGSVGSSAQPRVVQVPTDVTNALQSKGLYADQEGIVRWRQDSVQSVHPRRWSLLRKSYDSAVICFMEFVMTLISNTGPSIAPEAKDDLRISNELALFCFTTLYLLGQALGGLVFPPLAESFGGRSIYVSSTIGFSAACVILGACPTLPVVMVVRLITGFLSAMPAVCTHRVSLVTHTDFLCRSSPLAASRTCGTQKPESGSSTSGFAPLSLVSPSHHPSPPS